MKNKNQKTKDWEIKKLGEVCSFQNGFAFKSKLFTSEGLPILRISNIQQDKISYKRLAFFQKKDYKIIFDKYEVKKGDLVIAMSGATTGKLAISDSDDTFYLNQRVGKFIPSTSLFLNYLYYFLSTRVEENLSISQGSAQPNLSTEQIKNFDIPLPSINEQKRIVGILDEAFENIDKAKTIAEQNLKNIEELFESELQNIFSNNGGEWETKKIEELVDHKSKIVSGPFGSNLMVKDYKDEGVPVLRLQNIGKGYFINKNIKYITKEKAEELKYHSFVPGDIVLAKLGIPIGKTCIVPSDFEEGIITADIVRIRLNNKLMDYNFLEYILNTDIAVSQLTRGISGATRPRVNLSNVREIEVTFPKSITEQQELVIKIDKLKEKVDEGAAILRGKIAALDELKKSLLQKAFNGEL